MDPLLAAVVFSVILFVLIALGLNIAFSLLLVGTAGLFFTMGPSQALKALAIYPFSVCYSYILVVVPLFILMGHFAFFAGISRGLYDFFYKWVGQLHGGLAMASVGAAAGFAAVTGSSAATAATVGQISLPEMRKYGYDLKLATGSIASAGTLGNLIPPSVIGVVYGYITRESVGAILIAGILPGVLTAVIFMLMIYLRCRLNPSLATLAPKTEWKERLVAVRQVWGMLLLFLVVMGLIYTGVATPTEAGAIGCLIALVIALCIGTLKWSNFIEGLLEAGRVTAMVFAIVMGASVLGLFFASTGVAMKMAQWMTGLNAPGTWLLIGILCIYLPLGMVLEPISMMLLTLPVVYPIVTSLGFNGVWFGILLIKVVELGMITPPVGINVYVIAGIAPDVKLENVFRGCLWFIIADIFVIGILIIFPQISLWLPSLIS